MSRTWEGIGKQATSIDSPGKIMRFVKSNSDAKKLGDLIGEINDSIQDKIVVRDASAFLRHLGLTLEQTQGILVIPSTDPYQVSRLQIPRISKAMYRKSTRT